MLDEDASFWASVAVLVALDEDEVSLEDGEEGWLP
jgi:hypothetical protein